MLAVCQACQFFVSGTPCTSTVRQQVRGVIYKSPVSNLVSKWLCTLANDLLLWAQNNLRSLKHVPSKINQGADTLSRKNVSSEEWMLHLLAVQKIWEVFGRARVDLFASEDNSHCPIFFTKSTDALAHEWPSLPLYASPQSLCYRRYSGESEMPLHPEMVNFLGLVSRLRLRPGHLRCVSVSFIPAGDAG